MRDRRATMKVQIRLHAMRVTRIVLQPELPAVLLLAALEWEQTAKGALLSWVAAMTALVLLCWRVCQRAQGCDERDKENVFRLYRQFVALLLLLGWLWGMSAWWLMPAADVSRSLLLLLWLMAVSTLHGALLSGLRGLFYPFIALLWTPALWRVWMRPEPIYYWAFLAELIFLLVLCLFTSQLNRFALTSFRLRTKSQLLARQLADEQRQLERVNNLLEQQNGSLQQALEQVRELAVRDPLTGVFNMRALQAELAQRVEHAEHSGAPLALALLDLDHFKRVNDQCGHPVGDAVLQQLCGLVLTGLGGEELFGRYGGEEFLVLAPHCNGAELARRMDKVRRSVAAFDWSGLTDFLPVTLSCGVAAWRPGMTPQTLFQRADAALYAAKNGGRNQVRMESELKA